MAASPQPELPTEQSLYIYVWPTHPDAISLNKMNGKEITDWQADKQCGVYGQKEKNFCKRKIKKIEKEPTSSGWARPNPSTKAHNNAI